MKFHHRPCESYSAVLLQFAANFGIEIPAMLYETALRLHTLESRISQKVHWQFWFRVPRVARLSPLSGLADWALSPKAADGRIYFYIPLRMIPVETALNLRR